MRIQFVRTGGFAGMRLVANIDCDRLPQEEVLQLEEALDSAHFFNLPTHLFKETARTERFQYEITVQDGDRQHTVQAAEEALPENMQPLVRQLERLARTRR
jgi:hypothetical protein